MADETPTPEELALARKFRDETPFMHWPKHDPGCACSACVRQEKTERVRLARLLHQQREEGRREGRRERQGCCFTGVGQACPIHEK